MTPLAELLLKMTLVLALALVLAAVVPRRLPALRHLVLLLALGIVAMLPLVVLAPPILTVRLPQKPAPASPVPDPAPHRVGPTPLLPERELPPAFPWESVALASYGLGAGVLAIRLLRDRLALYRLLRTAQASAFHTPFPVLIVTRTTVPLACGTLHRVIVLPYVAAEWESERLDVVLRHESAHLSRRDPLWQLFAELLCTFGWFHPLVWLVAHRLRLEAEAACDRRVLDSGIAPDRYAHHLLEVAVMLKNQTRPVAPAMARTQKLEGRVRTILGYRPAAPGRLVTTSLLACGLLALPLVATRPKAFAQESKPALPAVAKKPSIALPKKPVVVALKPAQESSVEAKRKEKAERLALEAEKALRNRRDHENALMIRGELAQDKARKTFDERIATTKARYELQIEALREDLEELKLKLRDLDTRVTDKQLEIVEKELLVSSGHTSVVGQKRQLELLQQMIQETRQRREDLRNQIQKLRAMQAAVR